jgi:putative flavoprotein involved in K+ transport
VPAADGYRVETNGDALSAANVVVATGPYQYPRIPAFAAGLAPEVFQVHSSAYRNPGQIPDGEVLVVGSLSCGCQIAEELSSTRDVRLSTGRMGSPAAVPHRILGRHPYWWVDRVRYMNITVESRLGRILCCRPDPIIGAGPRQLRLWRGVDILPRAVDAAGTTVTIADGRQVPVRNVVWATGYRSAFGWIEVPFFNARAAPVHRRGVTRVPGLYFLGLSWQWTRGSALIGWVGRDAEFVVEHIAARRGSA